MLINIHATGSYKTTTCVTTIADNSHRYCVFAVHWCSYCYLMVYYLWEVMSCFYNCSLHTRPAVQWLELKGYSSIAYRTCLLDDTIYAKEI